MSLCLLGDELEYLRPNVYRNVARQLNITIASESIVSDAFLAVAAEIFSTGWSVSSLLDTFSLENSLLSIDKLIGASGSGDVVHSIS